VAARAAGVRDFVLAPPIAVWVASGGEGTGVTEISGRLEADAETDAAGGVRLRVVVDRVRAGNDWLRTAGLAQLYVSGAGAARASADWTAGRSLETTVSWRWPPVTHNPGSPNPQWQSLLRGYAIAGSVKSAALVTVLPGPWWQERAASLRQHVRHVVGQHVGARDPLAAAVVVAILIGDRSGLDPRVIERLQQAGTYHVVAISGGNVALVIAVLMMTIRRAVRSFRLVSVVTTMGVLGYALVVGGDPSVDRAIVAAVIYLGAELAGLVIEPLGVLAAVAILLVMYDPVVAVTPAAWLSFGATAGILMGADRIIRAVGGPAAGALTLWGRVRVWGIGIVGATAAAELALVPVTTEVFSRVSVAGLVLNLIAIPSMAMVELAGLVVVWLHDVPGLVSVASWVAVVGVRALVTSASLVTLAPWLTWRVPPAPVAWLVAFYVAVAVAMRWRGRTRRIAVGCAAMALGTIVTAPGIWLAGPPRGWLRLTVIDVGQGDALLLQFASGRSLLVDAGPATDTYDAGERVVTPTLWAQGVRRLDWLAFTHADLDHIGGALAVAETFRPREIWEGVPVPRDEKRARLRLGAFDHGQVWRQVRAGDVFETGGASVEVLSPGSPEWERQRVRNDDSVVLRVRQGDVELLLTGDISDAIEAALPVSNAERPALRVLKVAHHGSRTSTSALFVDRYDPAVAVISVGRHNSFGHPSAEVVRRLEAAGAAVRRTDLDGAVTIETDGREIRVETWSGRQWTVALARPPSA
jgi:competence protein ComEC